MLTLAPVPEHVLDGEKVVMVGGVTYVITIRPAAPAPPFLLEVFLNPPPPPPPYVLPAVPELLPPEAPPAPPFPPPVAVPVPPVVPEAFPPAPPEPAPPPPPPPQHSTVICVTPVGAVHVPVVVIVTVLDD